MDSFAGEMPFLDHLEELRRRIFRALGGLLLGTGIGIWLVQTLNLITFLKRPIEPFLPDGKLTVLSPTEPIMIVLKLALAVGLVLSSPLIIYQVWAFLSPALYQRERKAIIPALIAGMFLFLFGAVGGYLVVVPPALNFLLNIEPEALQTLITFNFYFSFIIQISLAMGLAFELPLLLMLLTWLGVVTPMWLSRFRQYAFVLSLIAAAILTPADITSMLILGASLIFLYEVGMLGSRVIYRRRLKRAAKAGTVLLILLLGGWGVSELAAQDDQRPTKEDLQRDKEERAAEGPQPVFGNDTLPRRGQQVLDSAAARRMGLPSGPSRSFRPPDAFMSGLLNRPGYDVTRYQADTATLYVEARHIELRHEALAESKGATLEADFITFRDLECRLDATGDPILFDGTQVLVGDAVSYNTCTLRGVVTDALTNFQQLSAVWFLRGNIAQDSSGSRMYSSSSEVTSCDIPEAHYHFRAHKVKWISESILIARPAVLYVRDVPILWLPFIFQDISPGRRSGILIPRFGINDIVRPNESFNRQITNVGYYWAPNDYLDVTGKVDWFSNRNIRLTVSGRYRWRDRLLSGSLGGRKIWDESGASSMGLNWSHVQDFNLTTRMNLDFNFESNTRVVNANAIDPRANTQLISSSLNFTKRYPWGNASLGGTRRQPVSGGGATTTTFPTLTISPQPLDLSRSITWSPTVSVVNQLRTNSEFRTETVTPAPPGVIDTLVQLEESHRLTTVAIGTPFRIGSFNWQNSIRMTDTRTEVTAKTIIPDSLILGLSTTFETGIDWQTGINLPILFQRSWKLQPTVSIVNTTSGPFLLRNERTGGKFVRQSKRVELRLSAAPTVFAFFPGFAGIARIRHSFSPLISYSLAPGATIPADYANATTPPGVTPDLTSDAQQRISLGLNQNFEGKSRLPPGDSTAGNARKFRVLGWQTSPVTYDFEQAKKPGRTGWATQNMTNTFQTDLIPSFNLTVTHDLWRGAVGTDSASFDPFLVNVTANFGITGRTVRSILSIFGLGERPDDEAPEVNPAFNQPSRGYGRAAYSAPDRLLSGRRPFSASFNYTLGRTRSIPGIPDQPTQQNLGFRTSFSPTPFWTVSWNTQYNFTDSQFEAQQLSLERDLHKWRARFEFVRNPTGNFALFFSIYLTSLPDIKIDYDQSTFTD